MKRFVIFESRNEIPLKDSRKLKTMCTLDFDNAAEEEVEVFQDKEEALEALKKYSTSVQEMSAHGLYYYLVIEYYVEEQEVGKDEFDEIIVNDSGIIEFTEMKIEVQDEWTGNTLKTFNNYIDAENYMHDYESETEESAVIKF